MRSVKTEGVVSQRRRDGGVFALEAFGALCGAALAVVEFDEEAVEGAPELDEVGAAAGVRVVWLEAGDLRADACDLAGSQIDQEIELSVCVEEGGGERAPVGGVVGDVIESEIVCEHGEAHVDHVAEIHLQRLYGAEAPEDLQDDLPERFHGWEYIPARGAVDSGRLRPPSWGRRWLKSCGVGFLCPTILHHHYPPFSHGLRTCPPRRRGPAGGRGVGCRALTRSLLVGLGPGLRRERVAGPRFKRCIVDAPYGFGGGLGQRD